MGGFPRPKRNQSLHENEERSDFSLCVKGGGKNGKSSFSDNCCCGGDCGYHVDGFKCELKKDEVIMSFENKLKNLMSELNLSQTKLSELTGISKPNISQYLSGKHEPSKDRRFAIARALGVQDDYFETFEPTASIQNDDVVNMPVTLAARLMKKSKGWVEKGLQDGVFPWGYAVKLKQWSYWISPAKFTEYTGINIPWNDTGA